MTFPSAAAVPAGSPSSLVTPLPVSVLIITHGRLDCLKACLESLARCGPPRPREILVVADGPQPAVRAWLKEVSRRLALLRWAETSRPGKGRARNAGVGLALGEFVCFLDDDVTVPPDFFERLAAKMERHPQAGVLGGPNLTPPDAPPFARAVGFVLESSWGAGAMRVRYRADGEDRPADDRSLILCNLTVRRALFEGGRAGFPEDFFYNEENVLLERFRQKGALLVYCPDLTVFHARRDRWRDFVRQVWHSGVGRGRMTLLMPASLRPDFLAPPAFLFYLGALSLAPSPRLAAPLALYAGVILWQGARYFLRQEPSWRGAARAALLTCAGHLAYGAGFFAGLARQALEEVRGRTSRA